MSDLQVGDRISFVLVDANISVTYQEKYPVVAGLVIGFAVGGMIEVRVERESIPERITQRNLDAVYEVAYEDILLVRPSEVRGTLPRGSSPAEVEAWLAG